MILDKIGSLFKGIFGKHSNAAANICAGVGLAYSVYQLYNFAGFILSMIPKRKFDIAQYGGGYVLITGASDGIGKAFAQHFARNNCNLIIVARNKEKLERVKAELLAFAPGIDIRVLVVNFQQSSEPFFEEKFNQVEQLNISVLVNNVGIIQYGPFQTMKESELFKLVTVNCLSQLFVTRKILPLMLKRNQKCAVVNVSSFSAYGVPYLSVYAATKAFNDTFSKSLSKEYLGRVDCLSLRPLYVESQMTKGLKNAISGRDFVEHGLSFLGRTQSTEGHWKHRLNSWIIQNCLSTFRYRQYMQRQIKLMQ